MAIIISISAQRNNLRQPAKVINSQRGSYNVESNKPAWRIQHMAACHGSMAKWRVAANIWQPVMAGISL
jgi:hypothetical protein